MGETSLLILYGSQTGNSREVSKELCEKAVAKGYAARVVSMADFKTLDFEAERRVVVVCSSTGNGDAPDNADRFYRYVKRKTTPAILAKSHFAVCAMGDQNYELFCEVGKQFDQHFERLGGTRFLKRCDVDEVEGIEETVHVVRSAVARVPAADGADVEMGGRGAAAHRRADATVPPSPRACGGRPRRRGKLRRCRRADRRGAVADGERRRRRRGGRRGGDGRAAACARASAASPPELDVSGAPGGGAPGTALHHEPGDAISVVATMTAPRWPRCSTPSASPTPTRRCRRRRRAPTCPPTCAATASRRARR